MAVTAVTRQRTRSGLPETKDRQLRRSEWKKASAGEHYLGTLVAEDTVVEFLDYQCPYCSAIHPAMQDLVASRQGHLLVVIRHFPLVNKHRNAMTAALVSECAARQLPFRLMHGVLLLNHDSVGTKPWTWFAEKAGIVDTVLFSRCLTDDAVRTKVTDDRALAIELGLAGTPSLVVNGLLLARPQPIFLSKWLRYRPPA